MGVQDAPPLVGIPGMPAMEQTMCHYHNALTRAEQLECLFDSYTEKYYTPQNVDRLKELMTENNDECLSVINFDTWFATTDNNTLMDRMAEYDLIPDWYTYMER